MQRLEVEDVNQVESKKLLAIQCNSLNGMTHPKCVDWRVDGGFKKV